MSSAVTMRQVSSAAASTIFREVHSTRSPAFHASRNGVNRSVPIASPNHQVIQTEPNAGHGADPLRQSVSTPIVALVVVAMSVAHATKRKTFGE